MRHRIIAIVGTLALATSLGTVAPAAPLPPGLLCEKKAVSVLRSCANTVTKRQLTCLRSTGNTCGPTEPKVVDALASLATKLGIFCPDAPTMAAAGYPAALTPAGLVARLQEACTSTAASLVARAYGGPQIAVRAGAAPVDQVCLDAAYDQGRKMLSYAMRQQSGCVLAAHNGRTCDPAKAAAKIADKKTKIAADIALACPNLANLITMDPTDFVNRATTQAECLVATGHGQTAPLSLSCGPRAAVPMPPLAIETQVVLDSNTWGTRCGDGSDFAFWIRLAPPGQPINKVVVFIAGGGHCENGPDCAATDPDLFESLADTMPNVGMMSRTATTNPFMNWTQVFIPYCTQDTHTGNGVVNAFPEMTVYRYGGIDLRTAMRYVRDVLWTSMDATDADGFRPDRLTVLFSGSSAGGIGAQFNYHYILDDLRWSHTTLLADSSMGVDNGMGATAQFAALAFAPTTPGWGALPLAPPYCHDVTCGAGWNTLMFAQAGRPLKVTPEQQILSIDNQRDSTQKSVGEFDTMPDFINTVRARYCEQQGTTGLHTFLAGEPDALHGLINKNSSWNGITIGGTLMRDWVGGVMSSPDAVIDKIANGTYETDIPGVGPFPCTVGSASGAFLDPPAL